MSNKATRQLPSTYRPGEEFNLGNWRMVLAMNAVGLFALLFFGWLFLRLSTWLRPEYNSPNLVQVFGDLKIFSFLLTIGVTMILHELVHGFFFWLYTRARPQFGFNLFYAYAAAPGWYFPRNQFAWVGLSPLVLMTLIGVLLLPLIPFALVPAWLLGLILNAAGAVGDLWVVGWLTGRPREIYIQDRGPTMQIYLPQLPYMEARWQKLLANFDVSPKEAKEAFYRLVDEYDTGERYYHTLLHVQDVLTAVAELNDYADDPPLVCLAAWYHDAVYDPGRDDNEEQSAQFAGQELKRLGLSDGVIAEVQRLIIVTANYDKQTWEQTGRDDHNAHVLLDADLAGLSAPWEKFRKHGDNIFREVAWVPAETYMTQRRAILAHFQSRERIYYTPAMFARGEAQARENIRRELDRLDAGILADEDEHPS